MIITERFAMLLLTFKYKWNWDKTWDAIPKIMDDKMELSDGKELAARVEDYMGTHNLVVMNDSNYPSCFVRIEKPPIVIDYEGDLSLLNKDLNIVGVDDVNTAEDLRIGYGLNVVYKTSDGIKIVMADGRKCWISSKSYESGCSAYGIFAAICKKFLMTKEETLNERCVAYLEEYHVDIYAKASRQYTWRLWLREGGKLYEGINDLR